MAAWDNDKIIHVDMTRRVVSVDRYPVKWKYLGGRALIARILLGECPPLCDPLGPENMLVMAPGLLSGSMAPTSGRLSVGCKSPLTGGIKEANVGGEPAQDLMRLGYRAVVITGQPAQRHNRWGLIINADGADLVTADEYKGLWNYACCEKLLAKHPASASAMSIGPAGEHLLASASIACTDRSKGRHPARHAARGGVGAVMGSKCLKWILIDPGRAPLRKAQDPGTFAKYKKTFSQDYLTNGRHDAFKYGTSSLVPTANMLHAFPYKNRTSGQNPEWEKLDGARILESFESRGGGMHNCLTGCIVRCSNVVHDEHGHYLTSALEFETITLMGSNCAINDWEEIARLDRLCDEVGLDTIETGAAFAVYMDSGGLEWGDAEGVKAIIRNDIANATELGRQIGNGTLSIGRARKHHRIPHNKGQAVPAFDPRPFKATGITYCSSAMGADHTAGLVFDQDLTEEEAVRRSQELQIINAVGDSTGFCIFLGPTLEETAYYLSPFFGEDISAQQLADIGWQCLTDEWQFNNAAGFTDKDDTCPSCLREEGIGPGQSVVFDISDKAIAAVKTRQPPRDELYNTSPAG